jgi:hypothetical protein
VEEYIDKYVVPYCQSLIDQAQAKIRTPIEFLQGNGDWRLTTPGSAVHADRLYRLWGAMGAVDGGGDGSCSSQIAHRYVDRFPELYDLNRVIWEVYDLFSMLEVGNLTPTVPPKGQQ